MDDLTFEQEVRRNFLLQRCSFQQHPLRAERKKIRVLYVSLVYSLVQSQMATNMGLNVCLQQLAQTLEVSSEAAAADKNEIPAGLKTLEAVFWHGGISFGIKNYQSLCLIESVCLLGITDNYSKEKMTDVLTDFCEIGEIPKAVQNSLTPYLDYLFTAAVRADGKKRTENASYLDFMYGRLFRYRELPYYHAAVCATMSAGKSTFINALLGGDYIPSGNEACTAKITSIADNDSFPELLGCCREKDVLSPVTPVTNDVLQKWNSTEDISRVFLEGDLQEIGVKQSILVVHDTPGTNSSENPQHQQRTMDFLTHHSLQAIIYLFNAEHISSTDNQTLLQEIKKKVIDVMPQTKIVFLVNKVDSFDLEGGEDLAQSLSSVCQELESLGFEKPQVMPVMAYAARLFKMALTSQADKFTRKEKREFGDFYDRCQEKELDLTQYQCNIDLPGRVPAVSGDIAIGKDTYRKDVLVEALRRTGICSVASLWDEVIQDYKPEDLGGKKGRAALSKEERMLLDDLDRWEAENTGRQKDRKQEESDLLADLDQWEQKYS